MRLFRRYPPTPTYANPAHGWSLGYFGTERRPLTWYRCTGCGDTELGSPKETPVHGCLRCMFEAYFDRTSVPAAEWRPVTQDEAAELFYKLEPLRAADIMRGPDA